jgi:capsular polysaccharide biosynthesis protein
VLFVAGTLGARPRQYQATATVLAPALVGGTTGVQYSGANGIKGFVANFSAALSSAPVLRQVAAETHAPTTRVKAGVSASEVGTSTVMRIIYKTPKRAEAVPVAKAAAAATIVSLFGEQVDLARQPVDAANAALADVEQQQAAMSNQSGLIVPDKDYEVRAQQIAGLQASEGTKAAKGHTAAAASLQTEIARLRTQLSAMAPIVEQFSALQNQKAAAVVRLDEAEKSLREAQSQLRAADPRQVVSVGTVSSASLVSVVGPKAAVAAGAGLFLAVGIAVALELWEADRGPRARAGGAGSESGRRAIPSPG